MPEVAALLSAYICCSSFVTSWNVVTSLIFLLHLLESLKLQVRGQYLNFRVGKPKAKSLRPEAYG
jgi:hypothetical protein